MTPLDILLLVAFAASAMVSAMLIRLARRDHPDIWRGEMGSVAMFTNNTPATSWQTLRYILSRRWRSVPDRKFLVLCEALFVVDILGFVCLAYFVVSVVLSFAH